MVNRKIGEKKVIRRIGTRTLDVISECYESSYDKGQIQDKSSKIFLFHWNARKNIRTKASIFAKKGKNDESKIPLELHM
jgi:hypothetical protein